MKRIFQITLGLIILLSGCQGPAAKKVTNTVKTKDTIADKESELDEEKAVCKVSERYNGDIEKVLQA